MEDDIVTKEDLIEGYLTLYAAGEPTHLIINEIKKVALDTRINWKQHDKEPINRV